MEDADAVVIEALLDDVLDLDIVATVVDGALDLISTESEVDPLPALDAEIQRVEQERDRLVAAVLSGAAVDALVGALRQREATLKTLGGPAGRTPHSEA